LAQPLQCETRGNKKARTLLAFPPEADEPLVQATTFISFWLKPSMFCELAIPPDRIGAGSKCRGYFKYQLSGLLEYLVQYYRILNEKE